MLPCLRLCIRQQVLQIHQPLSVAIPGTCLRRWGSQGVIAGFFTKRTRAPKVILIGDTSAVYLMERIPKFPSTLQGERHSTASQRHTALAAEERWRLTARPKGYF